MKRFVLSFLAVPLLLPIPAVGQRHSADKSKTITVSGRVSEDGKILIAKNGQLWSVTNPAALAGHENQLAKITGKQGPSDHQMRLLSVKFLPSPTSYRVNLSDAAFRR